MGGQVSDQNLVELLTLTNDLLVTVNNRLAQMEQHLAAMRGQAERPRAYTPNGEQAADERPTFAPLDTWVCPVHRTSRTVPAGVSKRTGKAYDAFIACGQAGCDEKPPRAPRPAPQRAIPPSDPRAMP